VGLSTPAKMQAVGDLWIALAIDELCSLCSVLCSGAALMGNDKVQRTKHQAQD
jgi:hypothetical protein